MRHTDGVHLGAGKPAAVIYVRGRTGRKSLNREAVGVVRKAWGSDSPPKAAARPRWAGKQGEPHCRLKRRVGKTDSNSREKNQF